MLIFLSPPPSQCILQSSFIVVYFLYILGKEIMFYKVGYGLCLTLIGFFPLFTDTKNKNIGFPESLDSTTWHPADGSNCSSVEQQETSQESQ